MTQCTVASGQDALPGADLFWAEDIAERVASKYPSPTRRNRALRRNAARERRREAENYGSYEHDGFVYLLVPEKVCAAEMTVPTAPTGTPTSAKAALGRRVMRLVRHAARRGRCRGPDDGDASASEAHA